MKRYRAFTIITLGVLLLLYALANQCWLSRGASLYGRDVVGHLLLTEKLHYQARDIVSDRSGLGERLFSIFKLFHEDALQIHHTYMWPKLLHVTTALSGFLVGLRPETMIQMNLLFFVVLIVSTYFIGRHCHSENAGLFAAVLVGLYPAIFGQTRKFGLDFPLTAMTALNILALLRTRYFQRGGASALLGLTFGLGILTKGQIVLYLAGPILYVAAVTLTRSGHEWKKPLRNICLFVALSAAISSLWWGGIVGALWRAYIHTVTDYPFSWAYSYKRQPAFSLRWLFFHMVHIIIDIGPLFCVALVLSLPGFLRSRCRGKALIYLWLIVPYAIWTLSNIKRDTDFFPCLPAVALVTAIGVLSWNSSVWKKALVAVCVIGGLVQFFSISFSSRGYTLWTIRNPYDKPLEPDGYSTPYSPPYPNNYGVIAKRFAETMIRRGPGPRYARIGIVETPGSERWQEYSTAVFEYHLRLYDASSFVYRSRHTPEAFLNHAFSFDYLIVMDRRNGDTPDWGELKSFFSNPRWDKMIRSSFGSRKAFEELLGSYARYSILDQGTLLPEGAGMFLCARPPFEVTPGVEFPASSYTLSDLLTTPHVIGAHGIPRRAPTEPEYDAYFPYWVKYPLVDDDLRYPGDPYFCEYELFFREEGLYALSARYASCGGSPVSVVWGGNVVKVEALQASTGGCSQGKFVWEKIVSVPVSRSTHRLRFEGTRGFPCLAAIRLDKM